MIVFTEAELDVAEVARRLGIVAVVCRRGEDLQDDLEREETMKTEAKLKYTAVTKSVIYSACHSPVCHGKSRFMDLDRENAGGERVYVCRVCGQEKKTS